MKKVVGLMLMMVLLCCSGMIVSRQSASASYKASIDGNSITIDFNDEDDLKYFSEFNNGTNGGMWGNAKVTDPKNSYWRVDDGKAKRDNAKSNDTLLNDMTFNQRVSSLTFDSLSFDNFEVEIVYAIAFSENNDYLGNPYHWFGINIGQDVPGRLPQQDYDASAKLTSANFVYSWDGAQGGQIINQNGSGVFTQGSCDDQFKTLTAIWGYKTYNTAKLKVVGSTVTQTSINASGEDNVSTYTLNYANPKSFFSFNSMNQYHFIDSVKITRLDSEGKPTAIKIPVESVEITTDPKTKTMAIGENLSNPFAVEVLPVDAGSTQVKWVSMDTDKVKVYGNRFVAIGATGSTPVEIRAVSVTNDAKYDTAYINVEGQSASSTVRHDFNTSASFNDLETYFIAGSNTIDGEKYSTNEAYSIDSNEGFATRLANPDSTQYDNPNGWSDNILTTYTKRTVKYFDATMNYKFANSNNGWVGFNFGMSDKTRVATFDDTGTMVLASKGGGALVWGKMSTDPYEKTFNSNDSANANYIAEPNFSLLNWNTLRVILTKNSLKCYSNGVLFAELDSTQISGKIKDGYFGFLGTNNDFMIDSLELTPLNSDGSVKPLILPTTLTASKTTVEVTKAEDGSIGPIDIAITEGEPNATYGNIETNSTNTNIAELVNGKIIFSGSVGTCTLTIKYTEYQDIKAEITVTVLEYVPVAPKPDETDDDKKEPPKNNGCNSSSVYIFASLLALALLKIKVIRK